LSNGEQVIMNDWGSNCCRIPGKARMTVSSLDDRFIYL